MAGGKDFFKRSLRSRMVLFGDMDTLLDSPLRLRTWISISSPILSLSCLPDYSNSNSNSCAGEGEEFPSTTRRIFYLFIHLYYRC